MVKRRKAGSRGKGVLPSFGGEPEVTASHAGLLRREFSEGGGIDRALDGGLAAGDGRRFRGKPRPAVCPPAGYCSFGL